MDVSSIAPHLTSQQVGEFYDRLDEIYRHQSAPHVHHGLWLRGDETREQARACKNCRYCKHCAKDGGTCGLCRRQRSGHGSWEEAKAHATH